MLRTLLLALVTVFAFNAQAGITPLKKVNKPTQKLLKKINKVKTVGIKAKTFEISGNEESATISNPKSVKTSTQTVSSKKGAATIVDVGESTYDLQSNQGMGRRVALGADGSVNVAWTRSTSGDGGAPDRGTGFNRSTDNGETWGDMPDARLEGATRVGWPSIGVTGSGRIYSITHTGAEGMNFVYSDDDGANWTNKGVGSENDDLDGVWPRAAVDGDNIHVIISRQTEFGGLPNGVAYFRSNDGGDTWDGPTELPQLAEVYTGITVDGYFTDVKGDIVVLGFGGYGEPVTILKSTNGGDDFEMIFVQDTDGYRAGTEPGLEDELLPTALADGDISVLIDNNDKVHVWYDKVLNYNFAGQEGPFFVPDFAGLMYWNEDMMSTTLLGGSVRQAYSEDGDASFPPDADTQLAGNTGVRHVSSGVDADNNLYISFSSMRDEATDPSNPINLFSDVYLMKSTDGGMTWQGPMNLSDSPTTEDLFPSMARTVDGSVHVLFQHDALAGTALQSGHTDNYVTNTIKYAKVPVDEIVTPAELNNTNPILLTLLIPNALVNCEVTASSFEAQAQDFPDGDLGDQIVVSGVDITMPAEDVGPWSFSLTDADGNEVTEDQLDPDGNPYLISVFDDTAPPIIVPNPYLIEGASDLLGWITSETAELFLLPGSDTVEVLVDSEYTDLGAEVIDEGEIFGCPSTLTVSNDVNTAAVGSYTVTYNAIDSNGNESEPTVRVVNVVSEDLAAPTLSLAKANGEEVMSGDTIDVEFQAGGTWTGLDLYAYDNIDGDITESVVIDGTVDLEQIAVYEITYTATDAATNSTSSTIYVKVADTQAPSINLSGPATVVWSCGTPFDDSNLGFTAFDNVDGNISDDVTVTYFAAGDVELTEVCVNQSGTYQIRYNVSDSSGNEASTTRNVIVPAGCDQGECSLADTPAACDDGIQNGDETGVDCGGSCAACEDAVGINDVELQNGINIFPNPTKGLLNVSIEATTLGQNTTVQVFNLVGELVQAINKTNKANVSLDLSQMPSGVYMVKVSTEKGAITHKVVLD